MSEELKPCPFCGKPFEIFEYPDDGTAHWLHSNVDCPMHRDTSTGWLYCNTTGMAEELNRRPIEDALRGEVARVTDERDAWFSWAVELGKKVGCLASTFPDSNSHISDAIDRLISSRDLERMAITEYLNEIDGVRQVYRRIDLSNSEIEEAMFRESAAIETLRRAASGCEMNTNDEYKVQSPEALEVERLREELARWASGETFSQHAAEIYENLRGDVARLTAELKAAREAMRWIPVGERLPEEDQEVICMTTRKNQHTRCIRTFFSDGEFYTPWTSDIVTHWMPLPPEPRK